jgi:hypothetical protein
MFLSSSPLFLTHSMSTVFVNREEEEGKKRAKLNFILTNYRNMHL